MDCCGHALAGVTQPWIASMPQMSVAVMLAGGAGPPGSTEAARIAETTAAALALLRNSLSVDVHSHGGRTGIISKAPPSGDLAAAMRAGSLRVACLADVPDWPVLGRSTEGGLAAVRMPKSGELYRYHLDRLAWMDELVTHHGVRRALCAADLEEAHEAREPAIVADVEGLDFLELKLERLEEAHRRGIRHVQLVHYTPNDIGDFQTGAVTHQGLTEFGAEVIRACDRLGLVCDVAHATEEMAKQAVKVAPKPLLLSHTALLGSGAMGPTPLAGRQVSPDYARAIAETGGSVGIWHFFPSLEKYVDGLREMAEIVGPDHVSIGTDQFDFEGLPRRLHPLGALGRRDAARRLHRRRGRQDCRRQLRAHLPRCGRLTVSGHKGIPQIKGLVTGNERDEFIGLFEQARHKTKLIDPWDCEEWVIGNRLGPACPSKRSHATEHPECAGYAHG